MYLYYCLFLAFHTQGNLKRADTRLQLHGVGLSTSVYDRCRSLIHPFSCSVDLEMVWESHSRDLYLQRYVFNFKITYSLFSTGSVLLLFRGGSKEPPFLVRPVDLLSDTNVQTSGSRVTTQYEVFNTYLP